MKEYQEYYELFNMAHRAVAMICSEATALKHYLIIWSGTSYIQVTNYSHQRSSYQAKKLYQCGKNHSLNREQCKQFVAISHRLLEILFGTCPRKEQSDKLYFRIPAASAITLSIESVFIRQGLLVAEKCQQQLVPNLSLAFESI